MKTRKTSKLNKKSQVTDSGSSTTKSYQKLRIAIFDLTDCEGCELEFINLRQKLAVFADLAEIVNWRFASDNQNLGPFDITFVEGSPITEKDVEALKQARVVSRIIVSLGSCAELGGIQSTLSKKEWENGIKEIYGEKYNLKSRAPKPLSYYVEVDYHLPGCPIDQTELAQFLASILSLKEPVPARYPVCLECKERENNCLFLEGESCLGPITKGGCQAVCPSRGLRCWGCFGLLSGGNLPALSQNLEKKFEAKKTKTILDPFINDRVN